MKLVSMVRAIALGLACAGAAPAAFAQPRSQPRTAVAVASTKLHAIMRSLWLNHIMATRDYVLAVQAGNKAEEKKAVDAEVRNSHKIAQALASFYGKAAGVGISKLLADHVRGVDELASAVKTKDQVAEYDAMSALSGNAMEIAKFLAGANPENWTADGWNKALLMHVADHHRQIERIMRDAPKVEQDKSWAEMQHHMRMMADALSDGIAKQFPRKVD